MKNEKNCPQEKLSLPPLPRKIDSRKNYLLGKIKRKEKRLKENLLKLKTYVIPGRAPPEKTLKK